MKPSLILIALFFISCKKQEINSQKTNLPLKTVVKSGVTEWKKFENEVFQTIENIENSKPEERRKKILKFIGFANKVDGAVAESYCSFAFEYIENNPKDFFSVLTEKDSSVIDQWAKISSSEIMLVAENTKEIDSVWMEVNNNHLVKKQNLNSTEIKLDELYLERLKLEIK